MKSLPYPAVLDPTYSLANRPVTREIGQASLACQDMYRAFDSRAIDIRGLREHTDLPSWTLNRILSYHPSRLRCIIGKG